MQPENVTERKKEFILVRREWDNIKFALFGKI